MDLRGHRHNQPKKIPGGELLYPETQFKYSKILRLVRKVIMTNEDYYNIYY